MLASRLHWRLLIGTIVVLMAALWLAPHWMRPPGIQENRVLAAAPAWPEQLSDLKAFRTGADAYVADHFPIRPYLIGWLNRARMLVGVSGSNRVIVGRKGWLFYDDDTHLGAARGDPPMPTPELRQWLNYYAGRSEYLAARHTPYLVIAAPVKETLYPQFGPGWYHGASPDRPTELLPRLARQAGLGEILYLHPALLDAVRHGQTVFSRHDTHWNAYGGYAGYAAIMTRLHAMGLTEGPKPITDFQIYPGSTGIQPRDLALMLGVANTVRIDFPHIENLAAERKVRSVTYLTDKTDWTAPQVVDTGETGKPVLLMTRDSFSNEILPLLYPHFSKIVLAHNQDGFWREDLIERFKPDIVILEVIEQGLRVSQGDGPMASPAALARIDRVLGVAARPAAAPGAPPAPVVPTMTPPDAQTAAIVAGAKPDGTCHVEILSLVPGVGGEAQFKASGWMADLEGGRFTRGLLALKGPGGVFVTGIDMDKARPDVGRFYKNPNGDVSGFVGQYLLQKLAPGTYQPFAYRRTAAGWQSCMNSPTVTMP